MAVRASRELNRRPTDAGDDSRQQSLTRLARFSLSATAVVALAFAMTVGFTQLVLEPIDARSNAIITNALPSVRHISAARDALTRLESAVRTHVLTEQLTDQRDAATAATKLEIEAARNDLQAELAAYRPLPQFPGEQVLASDVDEALARLDEQLHEALGETGHGTPTAAPTTGGLEGVLPFVERANHALLRLQTFDIDHGMVEAADIQALKRRGERTALVLSGFTLAAAVVAFALVMRTARRQEQAAELYERLLVARAAELEAFAGRVAHDLRDPLGALSMRLAVMQLPDRMDPEQRREHMEKAVRQVERIDHILDALLEFARAGANPPPGAHAELHEVLDDVVTELRPAVQMANATLRVDEFAPLEVACTPAALSSVLENLLGNAVKYVVEGKNTKRDVRVHVEDDDRRVRVEVADTGPGLSADAERRAFLPFVRVGETNQPGRGIGLATVKRLVETYGGRVGVRAVRGSGSVFWFELPKAEAHG